MFDPHLSPLPTRLPKMILGHFPNEIEIIFFPIYASLVAIASITHPITGNDWDVRIRFVVDENPAGIYITAFREDRKDYRNLPKETRNAVLREIRRHRNDYHVILS